MRRRWASCKGCFGPYTSRMMVSNEGLLRPVCIIGAASAHYGECLMSGRFDPPDSFLAEPARRMRPHEQEKRQKHPCDRRRPAAYDSGSATATHGSGSGNGRIRSRIAAGFVATPRTTATAHRQRAAAAAAAAAPTHGSGSGRTRSRGAVPSDVSLRTPLCLANSRYEPRCS